MKPNISSRLQTLRYAFTNVFYRPMQAYTQCENINYTCATLQPIYPVIDTIFLSYFNTNVIHFSLLSEHPQQWFLGTEIFGSAGAQNSYLLTRRRHREASEGRSVAPRWPRRTAILQRSAGGVLSLSLRIWSIHLQGAGREDVSTRG